MSDCLLSECQAIHRNCHNLDLPVCCCLCYTSRAAHCGTMCEESAYAEPLLPGHRMRRGEVFTSGTWRRRLPSRPAFEDVDYMPVSPHGHGDAGDDEMLEEQFFHPLPKIPWSAVLFATVLCIGGAALLGTAFLLLIGYIDPKYVDRTWPMLVLGFIMFLPGVYHLRIAVLALLNRPGYSFEDIPDFD